MVYTTIFRGRWWRGCILIRNRDWGWDANVPCARTHPGCYATCCVLLTKWWWGGVKFLHIERKITSVVHSHYIRKQAPGWLLVMFSTRRMQNKTSCLHFPAATLRCAHAAAKEARSTTSKHPTSILWMPPLTSQRFGAEWRILKNCESHNLTSPFLTRSPRVLWGIESPIAQPTFTHNAPLPTFGLLPGVGRSENLQWAAAPRNPLLRGAFPLEKEIRNPGAVDRITNKFTVTCEPTTHFAWENKRKVRPTNAAGFCQARFFLEKDKGSESGWPHHISIYSHIEPKTHFVWYTQRFSAVGGGGVY